MKVANKTVTVLLNALECKVFWWCFGFFFYKPCMSFSCLCQL